jgi:hypothetical protein
MPHQIIKDRLVEALKITATRNFGIGRSCGSRAA